MLFEKKNSQNELLLELERVNKELEAERARFRELRDENLLDETIYRLMALRERQRYLIKTIKEGEKK